MQKLKFLGASGEVTGSSYLLTSENKSEILIDFGMFQGPREITELNYLPVEFNASKLAGVFLTHAHLDHCGRLPLLVFGGYFGKIYMTAPTRALVELSLLDSARIAKENLHHQPLYTTQEVDKVMKLVEEVEYDTPIELADFQITFKDAGHILGSATLEIVDKSSKKKIVFSGDLGNSPEDIIKPTEYIDFSDIVVMECTYGDKDHPQDNPSDLLQEEINAIEKSGGVLLLPAFSLERTQELLHRIHHLKKDNKILTHTPVFLDSPMGIHATTIFKDFKTFYNPELQSHTSDPFDFEGLVVTEDARDSKDIIKAMSPKVIIAGSGMMSGGRILEHAINYLPRENTRILFVGYQAEETLGRKIIEGKKNLFIYNKPVKVRASVREIQSLSSHADQSKLLYWLGHIKNVKAVFLTHSDTDQRSIFADKIKSLHPTLGVHLPQNGEEYDI